SSMHYSAEHAAAVEALYQALLTVSEVLLLQADDLLIVDNHRMVHGRTAFAGTGRHIMRCYVNPTD
ncbi:MAG TPA: TauD/TfdA family dioxygenase, partial [Xanthomonadales bacterium]|nr:TauD/TfdA family dioxygenase [Xanthomonadales bacterium]